GGGDPVDSGGGDSTLTRSFPRKRESSAGSPPAAPTSPVRGECTARRIQTLPRWLLALLASATGTNGFCMRTLPEQLTAHLATGATTLCRCWRVTRRDAAVMGFTDHDEDLLFDGTTFRAGTGFEGAELEARFGLAVTGTEIHGALSAESLNEQDLAAGLYDNATVEIFLVNWTDVEQRILLRIGNLGEVRREGAAFAAE